MTLRERLRERTYGPPVRVEQAVKAVGEAASSATSERELLSSVAELVRSQVPYEAAVWLVTDPATGLLTDGVVQHLSEETCAPPSDGDGGEHGSG